MKAEISYKSSKKEVMHSISIYPNLYLCIIANPSRWDSGRYLRSVEIKREPIPSVTTRMFREMPFGYQSQREAVFLPRDIEVRRVIHPLLLEPFPDELGTVEGEILMRRRVGEREFIYGCILKEAEKPGFPLMEEYYVEADGEKEEFRLKDLSITSSQP